MPMKANLVKPVSKLKSYNFDADKIVVDKTEGWNSFSTSPKEGEKWKINTYKRQKGTKAIKDK